MQKDNDKEFSASNSGFTIQGDPLSMLRINLITNVLTKKCILFFIFFPDVIVRNLLMIDIRPFCDGWYKLLHHVFDMQMLQYIETISFRDEGLVGNRIVNTDCR